MKKYTNNIQSLYGIVFSYIISYSYENNFVLRVQFFCKGEGKSEIIFSANYPEQKLNKTHVEVRSNRLGRHDGFLEYHLNST